MKQLTCEPLRAEETSQDLGVDTVPVATTMGASRRHVAVEVPNIVVTREDSTAKGAWHGLALDSLLDENIVGGRAGIVGVAAAHMVAEVAQAGEGEGTAVTSIVTFASAGHVEGLVALGTGVGLSGGAARWRI